MASGTPNMEKASGALDEWRGDMEKAGAGTIVTATK